MKVILRTMKRTEKGRVNIYLETNIQATGKTDIGKVRAKLFIRMEMNTKVILVIIMVATVSPSRARSPTSPAWSSRA